MAIDDTEDPPNQDEDYDEELDSDFDADNANDEHSSSGSDDGITEKSTQRLEHPSKHEQSQPPQELDSGDEATINEQRKKRKKEQSRKGDHARGNSDDEMDGWRARTRAMRIQEKEARRHNKLATSKGSTVDVDKLWAEMNTSGPLPPVQMENESGSVVTNVLLVSKPPGLEANKENVPLDHSEEMVTIKRKFHFAGEIHVEEKLVPKSSAEARLWLAQQGSKPQLEKEGPTLVQRPLRKISRFDPNHNNLAAYKSNWSRSTGGEEPFKGPRLNVVEKSKMDWAAHVDAEGLTDELDIHAKAKEGYHSRMEFLNQVEQRKEEEARQARSKG